MAKTAKGYLADVQNAMARAAADRELPADEYRDFLDTIESDAQAALNALDDDEPEEDDDDEPDESSDLDEDEDDDE